MAQVSVRPASRRSSRRGSTRRRSSGGTEWILTSHELTLSVAVPEVAVLLIPNEIINFSTSPTYLGGHYDVVANVSDAGGGLPSQGFVSIGVRALPLRSFDAFDGVPPSELPLPWTDGEGSWAYHRMFYLSAQAATGGNVAAAEHSLLNTVRFHDVARSARRLATDEVLALVAEFSGTPTNPPTGGVCLAIAARVLMREP